MRGSADENAPSVGVSPSRLLPLWLRRLTAYCASGLIIAATLWVLLLLLLLVQVVTLSVIVAILLTALAQPVVNGLRAIGSPPWAAALGATVFLLAVPIGIGFLVVSRALEQVDDLRAALTMGVDDIRGWLITGPLSVSPAQVDQARAAIVEGIAGATPAPVAGATLVLQVLGAAVIALFLVFFFCKDGPRMWRWAVDLAPARHRGRVDGAGRAAWSALTRYVGGTAIIALIDATAIGVGLVILGIPLALPLALLVFVGAFVPLLGATISGAVAVAVALASQGFVSALITAGIVLGVQQVEGNLLQPLIMGRTLRLHPVIILLTVSAGFVLAGITGALIAVPLVAVVVAVAAFLRSEPATPGADAADPGSGPHIDTSPSDAVLAPRVSSLSRGRPACAEVEPGGRDEDAPRTPPSTPT